jgi:predicted PurR-regulated permease PerM
MTDEKRWQALFLVIAVGVFCYLIYLLAPVLTPFFVAALLAYMTDPLADQLQARGLSRVWSATIVFSVLMLVLLLLLLIFVPLLEAQIRTFISKLPAYFNWLQNVAVPGLQSWLGLEDLPLDLDSVRQAVLKNWQQAGGVVATMMGSISRSGMAVLGWVINLLLIPVVTFYLLRDWDKFMEHIRGLFPMSIEPTIVHLAKQSDDVLGAFLRGQILVMLALGVIYSIGLWMVGLDLALLIGMVAGLVSFVPYLGFFVGFLMAGVAAVVQFQEALPLLYVLAVFGAGQLVEGFLLTPMLVGERIGLHPVAVIFAVLAGGQLFGFVGILLALPLAAVIRVLLAYMHTRYVNSRIYGSPPPPAA